MAYTYEQVFAADPSNPSNVAQNASVTIFAPGDGTMTPLTITDPDGQPLNNPIPVNANGFGSAFAHATLDRVAWAGGGFTGFFTSYEGMKGEAVAAREAAEQAAATAGVDAAAVAAAAIGDATAEAEAAAASAATAASNASASATAAANSAALVGAPADTAIAAAINGTGATKTALNATILDKIKTDGTRKWKANTAYSSGEAVLSPSGDVVTARAAFTSGATYDATKWKLSTNYAQSGTRPAKAKIVFTFDDSPYTDKTIIMPLLTAKGIKGTFGVLTNVVSLFPTAESQLTYVDLKAWEDAGHEIASHSVSHVNMVDATTATAETEIGGAYNLLKSKGLDPQGLIWPHSLSSPAARAVARKYHTYGLGGAGSTVQPFGTYQMLRWGFGNTRTLAETTARIDEAVAKNEILAILVHSGSDLDAAHQTILGQVIDYAKASAADVVTAREAFAAVGNLYESGDFPGGDYTVIGGQGKLLLSPSLVSAGPGDINSKIIADAFYGPMHGTTPANAAPPLNTLHAHPLIITDPLGLTVGQVNINVTTAAAGSTVRVGVYSDSNGQPGMLIQEFGTFDTTATGNKSITGLNRKLTPGKYWVAAVAQGTSAPTVGCATGISPHVANLGASTAHVTAYTAINITGALPASFGVPAGTNFAVFAMLRAL